MDAEIRTIVVTGGSSGIGKAVSDVLRESGCRVVNVDLRGGDIAADLSTQAGREDAARQIETLLPDGIDGLVPCAGVAGAGMGRKAIAINFFGTTRLLMLLRPLLAKGNQPRGVIVSSSTSFLPPDADLLAKLMADDEAGAVAHTDDISVAYPTSKRALCHWVRRHAATPEWAGSGILLNGVAPGLIITPMTETSAPAQQSEDLRNNPVVPIALDAYPQAEVVAPIIAFFASPANSYMVGQVVAVDGGSDVLLRGEAIP